MVFKTKLILHSFENIVEKLTSLDVNNLTYLAGCFLFSVFVSLKKTHNLLYCGYTRLRFFLFFLLHSAQSSLMLCCRECIT